MMPITKVPRLPKHIQGVVNLRGRIIPVVDLRLKFGLEQQVYDDRTSIIVMELQTSSGLQTSGMVVDAVQEVVDITADVIEEPPKYGNNIDQSYLTGMGKLEEQVVMILDSSQILATDMQNHQE